MAYPTDPDVPYRYTIDMGHVTCVSFSEVSGLKSTTEIESVHEGGNNLYEHAMIKHNKYENLVIKKGFYSRGSEFYKWLRQLHIKTMTVTRVNMSIVVLNDAKEEVGRFNLYKCIPLSYDGPAFNATAKDILFESITVHYDFFEYHPGGALMGLLDAGIGALGNMVGTIGLPGGASVNAGAAMQGLSQGASVTGSVTGNVSI